MLVIGNVIACHCPLFGGKSAQNGKFPEFLKTSFFSVRKRLCRLPGLEITAILGQYWFITGQEASRGHDSLPSLTTACRACHHLSSLVIRCPRRDSSPRILQIAETGLVHEARELSAAFGCQGHLPSCHRCHRFVITGIHSIRRDWETRPSIWHPDTGRQARASQHLASELKKRETQKDNWETRPRSQRHI